MDQIDELDDHVDELDDHVEELEDLDDILELEVAAAPAVSATHALTDKDFYKAM
jgi:septation ring formation regulator EzrA